MSLTPMRQKIYRLTPRPLARHADAARHPVKARQMLIVTRYPNPTFSYYFEQRLFGNPDNSIIVRGLGDKLADINPDGLFVVFCRYSSHRQVSWVKRNRHKLAGVALFIDDDLPSILAGDHATWHYKLFLAHNGVVPLIRLNPLLSHVWISTEHLADELERSGPRPEILAPLPATASPKTPPAGDHLVMAYHATNIHRHEHEFLVPIVRAALKRHPKLHFQVFANGRNARLWSAAGIDPARLRVQRTLPWVRYVETTTHEHVDIALVPLLAGQTNAARADTKRIDVTRMGAAGIYTRGPIFERCAVEGEILISNAPEEWGAAIDLLVTNGAARLSARQATFDSIALMRSKANPTFPGVILDRTASQSPTVTQNPDNHVEHDDAG